MDHKISLNLAQIIKNELKEKTGPNKGQKEN